VARVDLHSMVRWQQQQWKGLKQIYSAGSYSGNGNTLRVLASIYNLTVGAATARWISISG
jgi:hypothetical protein